MNFPWARVGLAREAARAAPIVTLVVILALALSIACARAQTAAQEGPPLPPAVESTQTPNAAAAIGPEEGAAVAKLVAANLGDLKKITPELIALINADPALAAGLIEAAKENPQHAQALAELLSTIQTRLKETNPDGAKVIAALVAAAPAPFQAAYAVALAGGGESGGGTGGPAPASGGGAAAGAGGGGGPAGGGGGGSGGLGFGSAFGSSIGSGTGGIGGTSGNGGNSNSGGGGGSGPALRLLL